MNCQILNIIQLMSMEKLEFYINAEKAIIRNQMNEDQNKV